MAKESKNQFDDKEARARFEAALRGALSTPHKPHDEMKIGKSKAKRAKSPKKKAALKQG